MSWDHGEYYGVAFAVGKSRRYHAKLRAFYQQCDGLVVAATAATGTSAFAVLFGSSENSKLAAWLTGVVALSSTLDLVFRFSDKSLLHSQLCVRFTELAARLEELAPTEENLQLAKAERIRIEKDEPTEKRIVDLLAHNDEARARGVDPNDLIPIGPIQSVVGYVWGNFGIRRLERWVRERHEKRH